MPEQVKPEPGVAQIHQMRAGIGQRHDPGRVLQQFGHALVDGIEEAAEEGGLQILLEAEIEHHVERVAALLAGDVGDVAVGVARRSCACRHGDDDALPVALEHRAGRAARADSGGTARGTRDRGTPPSAARANRP